MIKSVRKIYFAGAIRGGREDVEIYLELVRLLRLAGAVLTEHVADLDIGADGEASDDRSIYERDLSWLRDSDCLVAEVTRPSLGVGFEIGRATEWRKPVLCLFRPSDGRQLSAMISGCDSVSVREYESIGDAAKIVEEFLLSLDS